MSEVEARPSKPSDISVSTDGKNVEVKLKRVRLSFCDLFTPDEKQNDNGEMRYIYGATVLLSKKHDAALIQGVQDAMKQAVRLKWGEKPSGITSPDRMCMRDGEPIDPMTVDSAVAGSGTRKPLYSGYEGQMYISSNRAVKTKDAPNPLQLLGPRKTAKDSSGNPCFPQLQESDGLLYSGAWVDIILRIYGYDGSKDDNPNRVNASLEAVKFVEHGPAFGAKKVDAQSAFDEEDDEDDAPGGPIGDTAATSSAGSAEFNPLA